MIAVGMMQMPVHQIVHMVAVRDGLMAAAGAMLVTAPYFRRAAGRIAQINSDHMLVDVIVMHVVQMAVMQIVDVVFMADRGVTAVWAMLMRVVRMVLLAARRHEVRSFCV
jgi:hypothetical protein